MGWPFSRSQGPREVTPTEAAGLPDVLFVDVREPQEWALCHVPNARHLPLATVAGRKEEIPRDRPVVLYCHHGMRSMRAATLLKDAGWENVLNLQGGIDRWAREMDPNMARY